MEDWWRGSFRWEGMQYGLLKWCLTHLFPSQTICGIDIYREQEQRSGGTRNNGVSKLRDEDDQHKLESGGKHLSSSQEWPSFKDGVSNHADAEPGLDEREGLKWSQPLVKVSPPITPTDTGQLIHLPVFLLRQKTEYAIDLPGLTARLSLGSWVYYLKPVKSLPCNLFHFSLLFCDRALKANFPHLLQAYLR